MNYLSVKISNSIHLLIRAILITKENKKNSNIMIYRISVWHKHLIMKILPTIDLFLEANQRDLWKKIISRLKKQNPPI